MGKKESVGLQRRSIFSNKRGDEKYYIIVSLILGIIVLGLALYFIFQEYFTQDAINWESCRQSVYLRNMMPEKDLGLTTLSGKELYPLKCQTQVINVNYKNASKVEEEFRNAILQSWYLVGYGDYKIFASTTWDAQTHCMVTARIHIDPQVSSYYQVGEHNISILNSLRTKYSGISFYNFLLSLNPKVYPFFAIKKWGDFKVLSSGYAVDKNLFLQLLFPLSSYVGLDSYFSSISTVGADPQGPGVVEPDVIDPSKGDIYIVVSSLAKQDKEITPGVFWLQAKDVNQLKGSFGSFLWYDMSICDKLDTIPA